MPDFPSGNYTDVRVHDIQSCGGSLTNGTGTYTTATATFACGNFGTDQPKVGCFYNITRKHNNQPYEFPGWKCTNSGNTSDFKAN